MIRRWNEEIDSRSSRAPALRVTGNSLFPGKCGKAADRQGFYGQAAVLIERVLLSRLKKFLAPSRCPRIQIQYAFYERIPFAREALGGHNLRYKSDLQGSLRRDGISK